MPNSELVQFNSVIQSCLTLSNLMDCSTPGSPVHHQLSELTQTHVHWVSDTLTISSSVVSFSSHLQPFPESGSFPMSRSFTSHGQIIEVSVSASVLPMNIQDWSPLGWTGWISLYPRVSQDPSPTPQFKSINSSVRSFLYSPTHIQTWLLEKV